MRCRELILAGAAFTASACGAQVLRTVPQPMVVHDDAVWIVETNVVVSNGNRFGSYYTTAVIVCMRDTVPACARVMPEDMDSAAFRAWMQSRPRPAPAPAAVPAPAPPAASDLAPSPYPQ